MPYEGIGGTKEFTTHTRHRHKRTHQHEHGDDAKGVIGHGAHRGLANQLQSGATAHDVAVAAHAHQTHGHAHGYAQQHQGEKRYKANQGNGVWA